MKRYKVRLNFTIIGEVYFSSHGVWVAQPAWGNYSCSFISRDAAIIELMLHAENQKNYEQGLGIYKH